MSDYIKREDATAVISKTLGSLGNSVVTEINSLPGYATQDNARFTQGSTQDLISREAAREAIEDLMDIHFDRQVVLAKARDAIVWLPSADRPTGRWMNKDSSVLGITYECSNCGRDCVSAVSYDIKGNEWRYNYCPYCGAKMEGGEE